MQDTWDMALLHLQMLATLTVLQGIQSVVLQATKAAAFPAQALPTMPLT